MVSEKVLGEDSLCSVVVGTVSSVCRDSCVVPTDSSIIMSVLSQRTDAQETYYLDTRNSENLFQSDKGQLLQGLGSILRDL